MPGTPSHHWDYPFARIPQWLVFCPLFQPSEFRVYAAIASHADNRTLEAHPSYQTLADELQMSRRTVMRAVLKFEDLGVLVVVRRKQMADENETNIFRLVTSPPEQVVPSVTLPSAVGVIGDSDTGVTQTRSSSTRRAGSDVTGARLDLLTPTDEKTLELFETNHDLDDVDVPAELARFNH